MVSNRAATGGANPPVCRLLNHSQVSFEAKVKERKLEKLKNENRRTALIKEVSCLLLLASSMNMPAVGTSLCYMTCCTRHLLICQFDVA